MKKIQLPPVTKIELNVAPEGEANNWKALDDLSTGQKATAVLLLLLLESDAPLVVDQPKEDLDNRFVTEGVVPKMREEKRRRQFVFTTQFGELASGPQTASFPTSLELYGTSVGSRLWELLATFFVEVAVH